MESEAKLLALKWQLGFECKWVKVQIFALSAKPQLLGYIPIGMERLCHVNYSSLNCLYYGTLSKAFIKI